MKEHCDLYIIVIVATLGYESDKQLWLQDDYAAVSDPFTEPSCEWNNGVIQCKRSTVALDAGVKEDRVMYSMAHCHLPFSHWSMWSKYFAPCLWKFYVGLARWHTPRYLQLQTRPIAWVMTMHACGLWYTNCNSKTPEPTCSRYCCKLCADTCLTCAQAPPFLPLTMWTLYLLRLVVTNNDWHLLQALNGLWFDIRHRDIVTVWLWNCLESAFTTKFLSECGLAFDLTRTFLILKPDWRAVLHPKKECSTLMVYRGWDKFTSQNGYPNCLCLQDYRDTPCQNWMRIWWWSLFEFEPEFWFELTADSCRARHHEQPVNTFYKTYLGAKCSPCTSSCMETMHLDRWPWSR